MLTRPPNEADRLADEIYRVYTAQGHDPAQAFLDSYIETNKPTATTVVVATGRFRAKLKGSQCPTTPET